MLSTQNTAALRGPKFKFWMRRHSRQILSEQRQNCRAGLVQLAVKNHFWEASFPSAPGCFPIATTPNPRPGYTLFCPSTAKNTYCLAGDLWILPHFLENIKTHMNFLPVSTGLLSAAERTTATLPPRHCSDPSSSGSRLPWALSAQTRCLASSHNMIPLI